MMATTPEGKVKKALDKMLKAEGVWFYSPQAGPYGVAGIPDRVAILEGLFLGVEAKADRTKKLTALQQKCRTSITQAGGVYFVVYDTESIENVRSFIGKVRDGSYQKSKVIAAESQEPREDKGCCPVCKGDIRPGD